MVNNMEIMVNNVERAKSPDTRAGVFNHSLCWNMPAATLLFIPIKLDPTSPLPRNIPILPVLHTDQPNKVNLG